MVEVVCWSIQGSFGFLCPFPALNSDTAGASYKRHHYPDQTEEIGFLRSRRNCSCADRAVMRNSEIMNKCVWKCVPSKPFKALLNVFVNVNLQTYIRSLSSDLDEYVLSKANNNN